MALHGHGPQSKHYGFFLPKQLAQLWCRAATLLNTNTTAFFTNNWRKIMALQSHSPPKTTTMAFVYKTN
jgi:hypothetical protein